MINPEWIGAVAEATAAVETGVTVFKKKADGKAAATSATPTVVVGGISGTDFLIGMAILALALVGAALIIHHGLTA